MAQAVNWDPNRYGSVKQVLKFDSATGTYSLDEQAQSYTGTSYNFTALPSSNTTTTSGSTTSGSTTTQTTQDQTTEAFGDVKPHYWEDKDGKDEANVFQWNEGKDSAQTEEDTAAKEYSDFSTDSNLIERFGTFEAYQKSLHPFRSRIESVKSFTEPFTEPFTKQAKKAWEWAKPLAVKAIDYITKRPTVLGSSATHSHRGIGGLYQKEINLMNRYGSTTATDGNPTGDTRKDPAGFNIVSFAGNYNMIGTYSRRHNMLDKANIHEKGSKEWKNARNKIRDAWENEKKTGKVDGNHTDIDHTGSKPSAPTAPKSGAWGPQKQFQGGQNGKDQGGSTGHGDAGKAGGESTSTRGSF